MIGLCPNRNGHTNDRAARFWLRSPSRDLGCKKPLDLIARGEYQRVVELLLALAGGVTA